MDYETIKRFHEVEDQLRSKEDKSGTGCLAFTLMAVVCGIMWAVSQVDKRHEARMDVIEQRIDELAKRPANNS